MTLHKQINPATIKAILRDIFPFIPAGNKLTNSAPNNGAKIKALNIRKVTGDRGQVTGSRGQGGRGAGSRGSKTL
ncbi:MAG: hypothetical protein ACRAVC_07885 [Trichormus sp.]